MINMDDPRHARLRRIVSRAFTPRMIQRFADEVAGIAEGIVDDLRAKGPCDFVEHVAARLPLTIICQLMGIPDDSYAMVLHNTNVILSGMDPELISEDMNEAVGQILASGAELADLVTTLGQQRAEKPGDDLISALVTANIDGEHLTTAELASFFILLVVAGNETTRNALSHALVLLTDFPEQRELLLADVHGRLEGAVEEIVRYAAVMFMRRTVTRDYQMNGHDYREGDKAVLFYWSANQDESVFAEPARFRHHPLPQPARRVRRTRAALLPGCSPGPAGDHGDAARTADPGAGHPRRRAAGPAAVQLHQRHQAPALRVQRLNATAPTSNRPVGLNLITTCNRSIAVCITRTAAKQPAITGLRLAGGATRGVAPPQTKIPQDLRAGVAGQDQFGRGGESDWHHVTSGC